MAEEVVLDCGLQLRHNNLLWGGVGSVGSVGSLGSVGSVGSVLFGMEFLNEEINPIGLQDISEIYQES